MDVTKPRTCEADRRNRRLRFSLSVGPDDIGTGRSGDKVRLRTGPIAGAGAGESAFLDELIDRPTVRVDARRWASDASVVLDLVSAGLARIAPTLIYQPTRRQWKCTDPFLAAAIKRRPRHRAER